MWITIELIKLNLCCFITILTWKLNLVLDLVLHFTCCVFDQLGGPPKRIVNFLLNSFLKCCHEIMEVQWISFNNIKVNSSCRLLFHHFAQHMCNTCVCEFLLSFLLSSFISDILFTLINFLSFVIGGASTSHVQASLRLLPDMLLYWLISLSD